VGRQLNLVQFFQGDLAEAANPSFFITRLRRL